MANVIPGSFHLILFVFILISGFSHWYHVAADQHSCQAHTWPPYLPDANVRFALLISKNFNNFDDASSTDCKLTCDALQHYLTVEWLVDRLNKANNGTGYIPGITLGFDGINDCSVPEYAARNSVSFTNRHLPFTSSQCTSTETNSTNAGFVMVGKSAVAEKVASVMKDLPVPIISATATLPELSDRPLYPNFFRTVLSDVHQMTLIADILHRLSWSYIAVAYQDNLYGNSGLKLLKQKAQEKDICIHKLLKLPGDSLLLRNEFLNTKATAEDQSIAVVVIADIDQTEEILCSLGLGADSSKNVHFILTEAVNKYIFDKCNLGSWTLTISTDIDVELNDLKSYINTKYQSERNKGPDEEKHAVIAEYMKLDSAPSRGDLVDGPLAAFISSTIHAVIALAETVRNLHQESCGGSSGLCDSMRSKLEEHRLLEILTSNTVNYSKMDSGVPPDGFFKGDISFSFNKDTGDVVPQGNYKDYTIFFLHNQQYENVGTSSNGNLQLDISQMETLSSSITPTSICAGRCDTCLHNGQIPIIFMEGDVYIAGVFSIHEANLFDCGAWRKTGNDAFVAEGFIFAIQELRRMTGINFGAIGFDDCYSPLRITSLLTDYMSNINLGSDLFPYRIPKEKIIGAIGCRSSGCTLATASVFMPQKIPLISYAASSPDLDDKVNYPYFLRTVPSDVFQAQVMVDIIKKMGWEYVGLLYVKNNYGSKGMLAFRHIVDQDGSGICVPDEYGISEENNEFTDKDDFFNAYMHLRKQRVKVVVFFGIDERFSSFLKSMEENKRYGNFIFLASEEWGINKKILNAGEKSARGSITLKIQNVGLQLEDSFKDHLRNIRPTPTNINIWYREFWQNIFNCNFKGGLINEFDSECNPSLTLSNEQIEELVNGQRLIHVIDAVMSMGKGFKDIKDKYCGSSFPCDYLQNYPENVVKEIMAQTSEIGQQNRVVFDDDGNGAIGFEVFNIQTSDGGRSYEYVKVGTFSGPQSNEVDIDLFKFYDEDGNTISMDAKCSDSQCEMCKHRTAPPDSVPDDPNKGEQSSSEYTDSDILIISLIIVLIIALAVVIAALFICVRKKYKVIEKKLDANEDQTYAEPERLVYAGPYNASRNGLVFSDPNVSPYQDSTQAASNSSGVNNPAYSPDSDHIDSVSQVVTMRRQIRGDSNLPALPSRSGSDTASHRYPDDQMQNSSPPSVPHYTGHPMPSTFIGRSNNSNVGVDRYTPEISQRSGIVSSPNSGTTRATDVETDQHTVNPNQISLVSQPGPSAIRDPISSGIVMTVPYSSTPEAIMVNGQGDSEQIIYYIRDSQGQLQAIGPLPRTSVKSDASSSVVAEHGPYSDALVQKRLMQNNQMQPLVTHNHYIPQDMIAVPFNNKTQHEVFELKDMGMPQTHPRPHQIQKISGSPLKNKSPLHYASPVHVPISGQDSDPVLFHQQSHPLPYEHQEQRLVMVDPNITALNQNRFGQYINPHRQLEQLLPGEDHGDTISKHAMNAGELDREEAHMYVERPASYPDVIATTPSTTSFTPSQGHTRGPSDVGRKPEYSDEKLGDVKFHQPLQEPQNNRTVSNA